MDHGDAVDELVRAANQTFYDAHEHRDMSAMTDIWEQSDRAVCIHPGWPILRGWPAIGDSWRRILSGPGRNQFILTNLAIDVHGDTAWVTLDENLVDGAATGTVAATNVFTRQGDGSWRLTLHHGSPVLG